MKLVVNYLLRLSIGLAILANSGFAIAQSSAGRSVVVSNVRVELDTNRVHVLYDVTGLQNLDSVYIQVESQRRGMLNASTVTGDVGTLVRPGTNKTVYWDYRLDGLRLDDAIRVTVLVKQPVQLAQNKAVRVASGGGPANALLSALAPGVGSIFVQPDRKVGLRPLITGAYVGLLVYGLVRKSQANQQYELYISQLSMADYSEANRLNHHYLVATWAAVGLLLTDVTYTFLRGRKNEKQRKMASQQVVFQYVNTTPTAGVRFSF